LSSKIQLVEIGLGFEIGFLFECVVVLIQSHGFFFYAVVPEFFLGFEFDLLGRELFILPAAGSQFRLLILIL
jgi:hypothetical protein